MQNPVALPLAALGLLATIAFTTAIDTYRLGAHAQTIGQARSCSVDSGHSQAACRPAKPG